MSVVKLFEGDERLGNLVVALTDLIYERGDGLPFAGILGAIEITKHKLMQDQCERLFS